MTESTTPSWTDGNSSDPGITLLELLAYSLAALGLAATAVTTVHRRRGVRRGSDT